MTDKEIWFQWANRLALKFNMDYDELLTIIKASFSIVDRLLAWNRYDLLLDTLKESSVIRAIKNNKDNVFYLNTIRRK